MNKRVFLIISVFILIYYVLTNTAELYTDYLWFDSHGGASMFMTLFLTKFNVHIAFTALFIALFFLNFLLIRVLGGKGRIFTNKILAKINFPVFGTPGRALFMILALAVVAVGYLLGSAASAYWQEYMMFANSVPFEGFAADPIFKLDPGFYVFSLPFYNFLYGWVLASLIIIALFSLVFHFLNGGIYAGAGSIEFSLFSRAHISILLGLIIALYGIGYRLSAYDLLFSQIGKFYGAGYTAVNGKLLAYNAAMVISFVAALLMFANLAVKSFKLPVIILAALIPINFIIGTIVPSVLQRFIVEPNELDKERPYISNNIKFTRTAYDIDRIKQVPFAAKTNLTYQDIARNTEVVENIRLWDWRPLKQTFKQLQKLKPYYFFNDVDVDRYIINGKKVAVNVSARELSIDGLNRNSQTWQNRHLIYTHGYGAVMSRVDRASDEGQPDMLIKDIPPKVSIDLPIKRPQIYYGEHKNGYVITNTSITPGEFDYPAETDVYSTYSGKGGIQLESFFKRLMFAVSFKDKNILISGNILPGSRILYKRNVSEMAKTFAPFLTMDDDPYLVIADGRFFWIIDAYTVSDRFPYSTPSLFNGTRINYIRNSVKVIVDAYTGSLAMYVSDPKDPLIGAYRKIFPGVFKEIDKMPDYLRGHLRYPDTLFTIQSGILLRYHMTDVNSFYNNNDAWHFPKQIYDSTEEIVESYYLVTKLPDEKRTEFILLLPFTPVNESNMTAFLTAKCDYPDYGELKLFTMPGDKLTYGPLQIESRINSDPDISKQLTLWNQKGSKVIRGNMLVIPVEESILYIEPLYLKAESTEMPELKQVIVAFGDRIVMEKDLATSLQKLFNKGNFIDIRKAGETGEQRLKELSAKAYTHFMSADQSRRDGNWAQYGKELDSLKQILEAMRNVK